MAEWHRVSSKSSNRSSSASLHSGKWEDDALDCDFSEESSSYNSARVRRDRANAGLNALVSAGLPANVDANIGSAVRSIALMFENRKYDECAIAIGKIDQNLIPSIVKKIPFDVINDAVPQSLPIIEAFYSKLLEDGDSNIPLEEVQHRHLIVQLAHWLAESEDGEKVVNLYKHYHKSLLNVLQMIITWDPDIIECIFQRNDHFRKCLSGLAGHGLVDASEANLISLHDALKIEFSKAGQSFKSAVQKLEELSLANKSPMTSSSTRNSLKGKIPTSVSHQRLMQMTPSDVQERLIKNKSLLNVVEPAVTNGYLSNLLQVLQTRIESDKEVLYRYNQVKRELNELPQNAVVAPVFQQLSAGFERLLDLMAKLEGGEAITKRREDLSTGKGSNGQATEGQKQTVNLNKANNKNMMKGPDNRHQPMNNGSSYHDNMSFLKMSPPNDEVKTLRNEVEMLRRELAQCQSTITKMEHTERTMRDRLSLHVHKQFEKGTSKFEDLNLGDNRPSQLIRRFDNLYSQTRLDAFDALDDLPEIADFDDLKGKLLFSVVVLAFRAVQSNLVKVQSTLRQTLCLPEPSRSEDPAARDVEDTVGVYLRRSVDRFDLSECIEIVSKQVWDTLFDYPSLRSCQPLKDYIIECVKIAWALSVQKPPMTLQYDFIYKPFSAQLHERFHSSDSEGAQVNQVLWPALIESETGVCVSRAVVVT